MTMPRLVRPLSLALVQIVGATLLTFVLLAALGPDPVYDRIGKSATQEQIGEMRHALGLDRGLAMRYAAWIAGLARGDAGVSLQTGEAVGALVLRALPATIAAVLPGFVLGHLLGLAGALAGLRRRGRLDRWLASAASLGTSLSFVIVLIAIQALLCSPAGLDLLPTRGWDPSSFEAYARSAAAPTLAMALITAAYALRYDRTLLLSELHRPHAATARAYGAGEWRVLLCHVLPGAAAPIVSRALLGLPALVSTGSLLLETQFGIPGLGQAACDAIAGNDAPVLMALAGLAAAAFAVTLWVADALGRHLDPRTDAP